MRSSIHTNGSKQPLWGRALLVWSWVALASIGLLWTVAHVERAADQNQAEVEGRRRVIDLTNSYAKQLQSSIERVDQLSLVIARVASAGTRSATHQIFQDLPSYDWFNPLLIDQYGIVRSALATSTIGTSVSDAQFFRNHLNSTSTELAINPIEPGVGKLLGKQVVRFSRRINDAQGKFAGVVTLSMLPDQLTTLGDIIALANGDVIGVKFINGDTLLRHEIGHDFSNEDFDLLSKTDTAQNFSEIRVPGNLMYVGRTKLENYPLEAMIAVTHSNILRSFNETSELYNLLQVAGSSLIIFLCLTGGWLQSRRDARLHHKKKINSTFRLAVDASREELYMFSPYFEDDGRMIDFLIEDCNGQAMRMSGREKDNLIGKRLAEIFSGDNLSGTQLFLHTAMNDGFAEKEVFIYREGPKKKLWFQARAVRDDLGLAVTLRDITDVKEKEKQLKQLALTDALTHLPNRHWMNQNYLSLWKPLNKMGTNSLPCSLTWTTSKPSMTPLATK